jgi:hypothetical protein
LLLITFVQLGIRSKERDSAIESLSHFKLKSSKLEAELSSKVKSQGTDIEELTARYFWNLSLNQYNRKLTTRFLLWHNRLEEMTHKFEAAEVARLTQEESSKQVKQLQQRFRHCDDFFAQRV